MTSRRKPPPARIYRREAYPLDRPGSTAMAHDEETWERWSDGNDFVANTGGEVRLYAGDITWREVPFHPADRTPTPAGTPRTPADLAAMVREIAADYDAKAQNCDAGDGAYGGRLVDELVAVLSGLAEELDRHQETAATDGTTKDIARAAARSVVEYVEYEGWFPLDSATPVPDACADAVVAALTATGGRLTDQAAPGCPKCGRLHHPWCQPYGGPGYAAAAASTGGA